MSITGTYCTTDLPRIQPMGLRYNGNVAERLTYRLPLM